MNPRALPVVDGDIGRPPGRILALTESEARAARAFHDPAKLAHRWRVEKRFALAVPSSHDVTVDAPPRTKPACETCGDPCCARTNAIVSLRLVDAARLTDHGHAHALVTPHELLARFPSLEKEVDALRTRDSITHAFVLDKRDDGSCVFFTDGLCTVHDVKPLVCRAFPFQLDETRTRVRWASSCESTRAGTDDDTRDGVSAALESYRAKVNDVVTRAFARDDVTDLMPHVPEEKRRESGDDAHA